MKSWGIHPWLRLWLSLEDHQGPTESLDYTKDQQWIDIWYNCSISAVKKTFFPSWKKCSNTNQNTCIFSEPVTTSVRNSVHLWPSAEYQVIASESVSICWISSHSKWQNPREKKQNCRPHGASPQCLQTWGRQFFFLEVLATLATFAQFCQISYISTKLKKQKTADPMRHLLKASRHRVCSFFLFSRNFGSLCPNL